MNSTIRKSPETAVPVKSLKKALDILSMLAFDDPARAGLALSEIARRMGMQANTAHNLLKTMVACGYAAQTERGAYCVGPSMVEMGWANRLLAAAAAPQTRRRIAQLCDELGEAVTLAALVDGRRIALCSAEPHHAVCVNAAVLELRSLYAMPTGRVLAAHAGPGELARVIARNGLPGAAWDGIASRAALDRALAAVRARGHERIAPDGPDLVSFAVPVFGEGGRILAALGCFAPRFRCDAGRQAAILGQLAGAAESFASLL